MSILTKLATDRLGPSDPARWQAVQTRDRASAQGLGGAEVTDMTDVQEVESAIGQGDGIAGATPVGYAVVKLIAG